MGTQEAADYLTRLLGTPGRYRQRWERVSRARVEPGEIHLPAVSSVLAEYLLDAGELDERPDDPARRVRDRVRRALSGQLLTPGTLRAFGEAFEFDAADQDRLQALLTGSSEVRVLTGQYAGSAAVAARPRQHRIISVNEHHYVNAARLPYRHRSLLVIESLVPEMTHHRYVFDSNALTVDVRHGGRMADDPYVIGEGLYGVDVELTRPLRQGEVTTVEYDTTFAYPEPPAPEFRRAGLARVENLGIVVQFDPAALPREVFFSTWTRLDGAPVTDAQVTVERDGSVHAFLARMDHAIAGFRWVW